MFVCRGVGPMRTEREATGASYGLILASLDMNFAKWQTLGLQSNFPSDFTSRESCDVAEYNLDLDAFTQQLRWPNNSATKTLMNTPKKYTCINGHASLCSPCKRKFPPKSTLKLAMSLSFPPTTNERQPSEFSHPPLYNSTRWVDRPGSADGFSRRTDCWRGLTCDERCDVSECQDKSRVVIRLAKATRPGPEHSRCQGCCLPIRVWWCGCEVVHRQSGRVVVLPSPNVG
jgi:hypothetical protein